MDNAILRDLMGQPWAILPSALTSLIERVKAGVEIGAAIPRNTARQPGAVAVTAATPGNAAAPPA